MYPHRLTLMALCFLFPFSAQALNKVWEFSTGSVVFSSPAIGADGTVYVGSQDNKLYAIHPDGFSLWTFEGASDWIDSSPVVTHDRVYVASWDNHLYCLDAFSGALIWKFETLGLINASPAVDTEGNCYIASYDQLLYSLDSTGSVRWTVPLSGPAESSPTLDKNGRIYQADTYGNLYAIDRQTGNVLWTFSVLDIYTPVSSDESFGFLASPAIDDDGVLYIGSQNSHLYAIDTQMPANTSSSNRVLWSLVADAAIDSSPAIAANGDVVFASRDGYLYRVSSLGILLWDRLIGDVFYSSVALDSKDNAIVVAYTGGNGMVKSSVLSINQNGAENGRFDIPALNDSSPNIAPDGSVYVGSHNGKLYRLSHDARLAIDGWSKFLGNRLNNPSITYDTLDFFPKAKPFDRNWFDLSNALIHVTHFPYLYHQDLGWLKAESIHKNYPIFYHPTYRWISTSTEQNNIFYSYPLNLWVTRIGSELIAF